MPVNPIHYLLALIGLPSAALAVLVVTAILYFVAPSMGMPSRPFLIAVITVGLPLFALSGGLSAFDPYDLGYRGLVVPALMAVLVAIGWWTGAYDLCIWVALAALLYILRIYGSGNLFDYLVDPAATIAAVICLIVNLLRNG